MENRKKCMLVKQKPYNLGYNNSIVQQQNQSISYRQQHKLSIRIQQLQLSLDQINKQNTQLKKLVNILTNQNQYYKNQITAIQNNKNKIVQQINKIRLDNDSKVLLVNQLKKSNRCLQEQVETLKYSLDEVTFMFNAQQQQIDRIKKQKQLIENEWSRVIRQINMKMNKMNNYQSETDKQNRKMNANMPLQYRVKNVLCKIDLNLGQSQCQQKQIMMEKDKEQNMSTLEDKSSNVFELSL